MKYNDLFAYIYYNKYSNTYIYINIYIYIYIYIYILYPLFKK